MPDTTTTQLTLGEYMSCVYEQLLEIYKDPDIASVAAAAMVNDMLANQALEELSTAAA